MSRRILLARHGRTVSNARGLLLGRANPDLDPLGLSQADALGADIAARSRPVGNIITSPLRRAAQTAEAIARHTGAEIEVDEAWIELDYGDFDERPVADLGADVWAEWRSDLHFRPPGGETLAELGHRVRSACDSLARSPVGPASESATASDEHDRNHPLGPTGETQRFDTVVVSHVSPIKAATAWALGVDDSVSWRLFLKPASLTTLRVNDDGSSTLEGFNATSHLTDL